MPTRRATLRTLPLLLLSAGGCGGGDAQPAPSRAAPIEHDFGTIRHGDAPEHVFELDIPGGGAGLVPAAFRSGCSCGSSSFSIRRASGETTAIEGLPYALRTLQQGDRLLLSLVLDTARKEPADQDKVTLRGEVVLQRPGELEPILLPVVYHFAIDAPIEVRPAAHVHFGALPRSRSYAQSLELHADRSEPPVAFGPPDTDDPRVRAELREQEGMSLLDVRFDPGPDAVPGVFRANVRIPTDLDGYVLELPVSGQLIPDIVVAPFARIGFGRIEMDRPAEGFVNVTDHDLRREPGFVTRSITDSHGADLSAHFETRFEPIQGDERSTRVFLRYRGTLGADAFRGKLLLAKAGGGGPTTEIEFIGFGKQP